MNQSDHTNLLDRARSLADDAMELHVLSFRMGSGSSLEEDYRTCQRIIAEADALAKDLAALAVKA